MSVKIEIIQASKEHASDIARMIMMAMTDECCLSFCAVAVCHWLVDSVTSLRAGS